MVYTPTTWQSGVTPASAPNMQHIETGISDAHTLAAGLQSSKVDLAGGQTISSPIQLQGSGKLLALWYNMRDTGDPSPQPTDLIATTLEGPIDFTNKNVGGVTNFFARITGYIKFANAEAYTIYVTSDDAVRVIVDGTTLFGEAGWGVHAPTAYSGVVGIASANVWLPITIEHVNFSSGERLLLEWSSTHQTRQTIPATAMKWDALNFSNSLSVKSIYAYRQMQVQGNDVWHTANLSVGSTAPSGPAVGQMWVDTSVIL